MNVTIYNNTGIIKIVFSDKGMITKKLSTYNEKMQEIEDCMAFAFYEKENLTIKVINK